MSMYFRMNGCAEPKCYDDGRTKQSFKDATDVNKILKKAQKLGGLAHVQKYGEAEYGEFADYDLMEAFNKVERAREIFSELPSEVRKEFDGDALKFAGFASSPENVGRLAELVPAIAEPGAFFPNPVSAGGKGAGAATAPVEPEGEQTPNPTPSEAPAENST